MHVTFTEDWRGYERGETYNIAHPLGEVAIDAGVADHATKLKGREFGPDETATRNPASENTAGRTRNRDGICGAELESGGVCKRDTDGSRCWQHETEES